MSQEGKYSGICTEKVEHGYKDSSNRRESVTIITIQYNLAYLIPETAAKIDFTRTILKIVDEKASNSTKQRKGDQKYHRNLKQSNK